MDISKQTARRFVLGRQGLWPGRRWKGKEGAEEAMRVGEFLQLDPLRPVARAHDLVLHSRVESYREGMFEEVTYKDRQFFDWGGWLAAMPMEELPYWRVIMDRTAVGRWGTAFAAEHADVIKRVRDALAERGPLMNRDFEAGKKFEGAYRSAKDTGLALYYLWIKGEVMTYDRRRFERVYHLREAVAPEHLWHVAHTDEAQRHMVLKQIAYYGIGKMTTMMAPAHPPSGAKGLIAELEKAGFVARVTLEGVSGERFILTRDLPDLEIVASGGIPESWAPLGPTTEDEATFLSPLDIVSARGRAKLLFDFDYIWEVYKPAHLRRWGYNTPILYRDQLVGRIEPTLDRKTATLSIIGLWLDDPALEKSAKFGKALARGVKRMAKFADAKSIEVSGIEWEGLRKRIG